MASHSAKSLFDKNLESANECLKLYEGVSKLGSKLQVDWILRAAVVFVVSAIDTYFHDKVRYRVGSYSLENLPPALARFQVPVADLTAWEKAERKGNVLRNWVVDHLSVRPLQKRQAISEALKLAGIEALWDTIEPDPRERERLLGEFDRLVKRRHQIAHEGDRQTSRGSGKALREIDQPGVEAWVKFARELVEKIENAFPR